jgi:hypothetical protein
MLAAHLTSKRFFVMPRPVESVEALHAHTIKVFRRGAGTRPQVALVDLGEGRHAVLKDYSLSDPWFARLIGPLSARREAWALRKLEGVAGVPRLLGQPTHNALLMEYIEGESVRDLRRGALTAEFFERFYALVANVHRRGLAHCDLRSKGNIIVGPNNQPYLVDFVAHFKNGQWWNPLTRWAYRKLCEADRTGVARMKKKFLREALTEDEKVALKRDGNTFLARAARVVGRSIRNVTRWLLTRRTH